MRQRGFTLTEMLVATMVFLVGFTSVYGLYLAGLKFRSQSDQMLRMSMASNNLVGRLRVQMSQSLWEDPSDGDSPTAFVGDGFPPAEAINRSDLNSVELHALPENPAVLYVIYHATDARNMDARNTTLRVHYALISTNIPYGDHTTLDVVAADARIELDDEKEERLLRMMSDEELRRYEAIEETDHVQRVLHLLEQRGMAHLDEAILLRRP